MFLICKFFCLKFYSNCKNLIDQFTNEEGKIILEVEKAGSFDEKDYEFFDNFETKQAKLKNIKKNDFLKTSKKTTESIIFFYFIKFVL